MPRPIAPAPFEPTPEREVYTVSRLNNEVRALLEDVYPLIWVEGELSNLRRWRSGHLYFTLKDEQAQIAAAMFRMQNRLLDFTPEDGLHVLVRGRLSLYRERGTYQLIADYMEPAGAGALRRAFDLLRKRLAEEGLFDPARKQPLPPFPRRIGVVTSPSGAAIRDVLHVLGRRSPWAEVVVYPTRVQGEGAAREVAAAVARADDRAECDVLLVVRGGGSLEDLWAFNEEVTARAIAACRLPVVCGIGHEVDFTIADLVADARAPTPSAAAELVSPDGAEIAERIARLRARLGALAAHDLAGRRRALELTVKRLRHPSVSLAHTAQRVDELWLRGERAVQALFGARHRRLVELGSRIGRVDPERVLRRHGALTRELRLRLAAAADRRLAGTRAALTAAARALHAVSPERTLDRGYAVVTAADGEVLRDAAAAARGDRIRARLARGALRCLVEGREPGREETDEH